MRQGGRMQSGLRTSFGRMSTHLGNLLKQFTVLLTAIIFTGIIMQIIIIMINNNNIIILIDDIFTHN